jgi:CheY-like chemotaxis protein
MWPVKIDTSQIDQIMANLCANARDAIAGVGKVTIETCNTVIDETFRVDHPEFVPGEYVLLTVSDDGCGMDEDTQAHMFEPFFTTKGVSEGTGLGLATVYGIVKQNKGFIYANSAPESGASFKIYLPRHAAETEEEQKESIETPAARGHETILLVEDETAILNMTKRMLENYGYQILAASTPSEAIGFAKEYSGKIHLLLTDVVMPEMNGQDLAKNLITFCPELKCLFASGYTANVVAHHVVPDESFNFIQKPFLMQELAAKVREVLDSK